MSYQGNSYHGSQPVLPNQNTSQQQGASQQSGQQMPYYAYMYPNVANYGPSVYNAYAQPMYQQTGYSGVYPTAVSNSYPTANTGMYPGIPGAIPSAPSSVHHNTATPARAKLSSQSITLKPPGKSSSIEKPTKMTTSRPSEPKPVKSVKSHSYKCKTCGSTMKSSGFSKDGTEKPVECSACMVKNVPTTMGPKSTVTISKQPKSSPGMYTLNLAANSSKPQTASTVHALETSNKVLPQTIVREASATNSGKDSEKTKAAPVIQKQTADSEHISKSNEKSEEGRTPTPVATSSPLSQSSKISTPATDPAPSSLPQDLGGGESKSDGSDETIDKSSVTSNAKISPSSSTRRKRKAALERIRNPLLGEEADRLGTKSTGRRRTVHRSGSPMDRMAELLELNQVGSIAPSQLSSVKAQAFFEVYDAGLAAYREYRGLKSSAKVSKRVQQMLCLASMELAEIGNAKFGGVLARLKRIKWISPLTMCTWEELLAAHYAIVMQLKHLDKNKSFSKPVDVERYPDYRKQIMKRTDLSTIANSIFTGKVVEELPEDKRDLPGCWKKIFRKINRVWKNARAFNPKAHPLHVLAVKYEEKTKVLNEILRKNLNVGTYEISEVFKRPNREPHAPERPSDEPKVNDSKMGDTGRKRRLDAVDNEIECPKNGSSAPSNKIIVLEHKSGTEKKDSDLQNRAEQLEKEIIELKTQLAQANAKLDKVFKVLGTAFQEVAAGVVDMSK